MSAPFEITYGSDRRIFLVCDHASGAVPPSIDLQIPPALYDNHIAVDIGAAALTRALAALLDAPAILGRWSRLVADCNRAFDSPGLVPESSDGHAIPGNIGLSDEQLADRRAIHAGFHDALENHVLTHRPALLVSVHSFTPALATDPAPRPWPVAVLWNRDDRAAHPALASLRAECALGGPVGENEPYSGATLNYTMDRHGEDRGIPYLGLEIRQDEINTPAGVTRIAPIIARAIAASLAAVGV